MWQSKFWEICCVLFFIVMSLATLGLFFNDEDRSK